MKNRFDSIQRSNFKWHQLVVILCVFERTKDHLWNHWKMTLVDGTPFRWSFALLLSEISVYTFVNNHRCFISKCPRKCIQQNLFKSTIKRRMEEILLIYISLANKWTRYVCHQNLLINMLCINFQFWRIVRALIPCDYLIRKGNEKYCRFLLSVCPLIIYYIECMRLLGFHSVSLVRWCALYYGKIFIQNLFEASSTLASMQTNTVAGRWSRSQLWKTKRGIIVDCGAANVPEAKQAYQFARKYSSAFVLFVERRVQIHYLDTQTITSN